jgi:glycerophosphoryl diester phosphodiesterase
VVTRVHHVWRATWRALGEHLRPLLAFHLYFTVLAVSAIVPAVVWFISLMARLSGPGVLGNEELVRFLLTPTGVAAALAAATIGAAYLFLQHAGVMVIAAHRGDHHALHAAAVALWWIARNLHRLLALAGRQVLAHAAIAMPFVAAMVVAYQPLLGTYDPYYVLAEQPSDLWWFLGIAGGSATAMFILNGHLYLRWSLALPSMVLDGRSPGQALAQSTRLTRGSRRHIGAWLLALAVGVVVLPALTASAFGNLAEFVVDLPVRAALLLPAMLALLAGYVLIGAITAFISVCMNGLAILHLYRSLGGSSPVAVPDRAPRRTGAAAWALEALVVLFAASQVALALSSLDARDLVAVTAHRGSPLAAPENTLPAMERAIADGADFVELDVRQTRDAHLVLSHDKDFLRTAGIAVDVWEMTLAEIRRLDVGSHFDPAFAGTRVPTLTEAITTLRGRAGLYLELKTADATPDLLKNVIRTLREQRFLEHTILASLDAAALRTARELAPRLRTSLLVHTAIGAATEPVSAQALRVGLLDAATVQRLRSHGQEVHVWTVNDPRTMARCLDLGVDNIITDTPEELVRLLRARAAMSDAGLLLARLRSLIW